MSVLSQLRDTTYRTLLFDTPQSQYLYKQFVH